VVTKERAPAVYIRERTRLCVRRSVVVPSTPPLNYDSITTASQQHHNDSITAISYSISKLQHDNSMTIASQQQHNGSATSSYTLSCRSPVHPALFAMGDGTGKLDLWNINKDTEVFVYSLSTFFIYRPSLLLSALPSPLSLHTPSSLPSDLP
jgi:hypothetical protein